MTKPPIVRHPSQNLQAKKRLERIVDEFTKTLKSQVRKSIADGILTELAIPSSGEALLDLRRNLVNAVKEGMLERKDQEATIGIMAAMVWFARLDQDRQRQILEYWL